MLIALAVALVLAGCGWCWVRAGARNDTRPDSWVIVCGQCEREVDRGRRGRRTWVHVLPGPCRYCLTELAERREHHG